MDLLKYRQQYSDLYQASARQVAVVEVPPLQFLMLDGQGDPAGPGFAEAVASLYKVAYSIKFWPKKHAAPVGYTQYKMPPLEALWWVEGASGPAGFLSSRQDWRWTAMIMQPDFVTAELLQQVQSEAVAKPIANRIQDVRLQSFIEGPSVQVLHVGPYDSEPETITKLDQFIEDHGLSVHGRHHEIYLNDPGRTAPEKLKTILRHPV